MLKKLVNLTVCIVFFGYLTSCTDKSDKTNSGKSFEKSKVKGYLIDNSLPGEIDEKIKPFNSRANSNISWTVFENGKIVASAKEEGEPALSFTSFIDRSIIVDCSNGINEGLGFTLTVSEDTSFLNLNVTSSVPSLQFRQRRNSDFQPPLIIPCATCKVQLANNPSFEKGEIVQGKVELVSEPFYQLDNGIERQLMVQITAYFRSEPLPVTENGYKTLKKDWR